MPFDKKKKIVDFILFRTINVGLDNSVPRSIYEEANKAINKGTELFYIFLVYISVPGGMVPFIFLSLFLYYKANLGDDAYTLPFLITYVTINFSVHAFFQPEIGFHVLLIIHFS